MKKNSSCIFVFIAMFANFSIAQTAYITNNLDKSISVIDTKLDSVTHTILVGSRPSGVSVSKDGSTIYISNQDSTISVINTATNAISATIKVGSWNLYSAYVNPIGSKVYVGGQGSNSIMVINTSTNAVSDIIQVGDMPHGICGSPDGTRLYVTTQSDTVWVIDTPLNKIIARILVCNLSWGICVSPDGSEVYVANSGTSILSVINTKTNSVSDEILVGSSPVGVSLNPNGTRLYVTNQSSNTVSVINTATKTVIKTIAVGKRPLGISVSPDGNKVYVVNSDANTVSVINSITNTVIKTIAVGSQPESFGNFISTFPAITIDIARQNLEEENISVYPNPTNGQFVILLPTENGEINVTNSIGETIINTVAFQKTINLELKENGVYFIYVKTKQGNVLRKLIVNR